VAVDDFYVRGGAVGLLLGGGGVAAALVAAVACIARGRKGVHRDRWAWMLLAASAGLFGAGVVAWLIAGEEDAGWPQSAALLAACLVAGGAATLMPGAPPHASGRGRTLVDGLIVAASALLVAWTLGLDDLYRDAPGSAPGLVTSVALAYVALAACIVVMATRARSAARPGLVTLSLAFAALALGSAGLAYLTLGGSAGEARLLYAGWAVGWVLVARAALGGVSQRRSDEIEPGLPTRASVFVPSVPFAIALLAAAAAGARGEFTGFLIWCGAAIVVLIVARQVLALVENISFWRRLERKVEARTEEVRHTEARFRSLVQNSSDVIAVIAADGTVRYQSPSTRAIFGVSPVEPAGRAPLELFHEQDLPRLRAVASELAKKPAATASVECRVRHRDGGWRHVEAMVSNLLADPAVRGFVVNARDITERKQLEEQLTHRAFHDPLTNLPNRALFGDRLDHALRRVSGSSESIAVLFLDLDQFKDVNDSLGHGTGDDLLTAVADRIHACLRPGDTVARFGGDEFAILIDAAATALEAGRVAELVLRQLEPPVDVGGRQVRIRGSVGIATSDTAGPSAEELLSAADVAMYTAKGKGGGGYEFFQPSMHESLVERLELEENLRDAIARDEFVLDYQPVVSLKTRAVRGVEALIRWGHPSRGLLDPERFIGLAEDTGLMVPIGRWILRAACRQAAEWQERFAGEPSRIIVVNLSATQLTDPELVEDVQLALIASGLNPTSLVLEITESAIVESPTGTARLRQLHELGVRISIDDFGTGYSALSYLRRLPIDLLKIDRVFLEGIERGSQQAAIVEAMIKMCHSLGITSVAEGVERAEEAEELERMGCTLAQGFYFERPMPPDRITRLLATGDAIDPDRTPTA
jgi:diguanylate cyclase (GGDEF)-like protein/PAS domain S-box-containing protein